MLLPLLLLLLSLLLHLLLSGHDKCPDFSQAFFRGDQGKCFFVVPQHNIVSTCKLEHLVKEDKIELKFDKARVLNENEEEVYRVTLEQKKPGKKSTTFKVEAVTDSFGHNKVQLNELYKIKKGFWNKDKVSIKAKK